MNLDEKDARSVSCNRHCSGIKAITGYAIEIMLRARSLVEHSMHDISSNLYNASLDSTSMIHQSLAPEGVAALVLTELYVCSSADLKPKYNSNSNQNDNPSVDDYIKPAGFA